MTNTARNPENGLFHDSTQGRRHQSWVLGSAACLVLLGGFLPALTISQQFWLVLFPIVVIGLSHGGADPMILQHLTRNRRLGMVQATGLYLAAAGAFVALIWWMPLVALITFLLLSAWHFGYTDVAFACKRPSHGLIWLCGGLTIIGPMAGHPLQTGELFAWLIGRDPLWPGEFVRIAGPLLGVAWICGFAVIAYQHRAGIAPRALAELALLAGTMFILPPLLAFAYYFCCVHSLRHFLVIAAFDEERTARQSITGAMIRRVAPATAAAILLALIAWSLIVMLAPEPSLLEEAVRVMFWTLAALTLPHALAVTLWWRHGATDRPGRTALLENPE